MSYGRRNSYGGGSYGGRRQANFGGPKPVEIGKEYMFRSQKGVTGVMALPGYKVLLYLLKMEK